MTATAAAKKPKELEIGQKAPDFSMPTNKGDVVSLAALKGKTIVLYFYPKDDTPGCTQEAKDFRDSIAEFEKAGAVVIGVSKDSLKSHENFQKKYCLPFPLASDEGGQVCENYGVWVQKSMYGKTYMGIERSTFVIDKAGKLADIVRKVKVEGHVAAMLDAVKALA